MTPGLVRRLTLGLVAVYTTLGTLEVVLKMAEDAEVATIAFFGGTLLGAACLIVCGLVAHLSATTRQVLIMLGAATGLPASAWTLLVPVLAITVIVANAQRPTLRNPESDSR